MYQFQPPQMPQNGLYGAFNQRWEIIRVNGENGAKALQMPPNSSVLLLDESAPIVWLKTTDGAGYPQLSAYEIKPHTLQTTVDGNNLEARIRRLEELYESYASTPAKAE